MFFFIPIGHEDSRIHRFPVVSLAIVLACLMAFASTWPRCQEEERQLSRAFVTIQMKATALAHSEHGEIREFTDALEEARNAGNLEEFLGPIERAIAKSERLYGEEDDLTSLKDEIQRAKGIFENQVFRRYGLISSSPRALAFLTSMFLHGGYLHLIFNLVFFILVGPTLEDRWGRIAFPIVYLLSGLSAAIGFMIVSGPVSVPMIGASGAIAGLMGAFLVSFTHTRIRVCGIVFLFVLARVFTFTIPAWVFLPLWIGGEIFQGVLQLGTAGAGGGGVAHCAHVAGFFFGFGMPFVLRFSGLDRKLFPLYATEDGGKEVRVADAGHAYMHDSEYKQGVRLREECDWTGAAESFQALVEKYPDLPGPRLDLAEVYRLDCDIPKLREVLQEALELAARTKDKGIVGIYEALRRESPKPKLSPECLYRIGLAYERAGQTAEAVEHLRRFLDQFPEHPMRLRAAVRLADLFAAQGDARGARKYLEEFRETSDPLWRQEVARRLQGPGEGPAGQGISNQPEERFHRTTR